VAIHESSHHRVEGTQCLRTAHDRKLPQAGLSVVVPRGTPRPATFYYESGPILRLPST
jgi:hypothetical protein